MGWADELHDASFKGVEFECITVSDSLAKTIAIHQAPYSNEASIEDMGNEPRRVAIRAVYAGDDYLVWLKALQAALDEHGAGEFVHPVFGVKQAQLLNYNVDHDAENVNCCYINIDLVLTKAERLERFVPIRAAAQSIAPRQMISSPATWLQQQLQRLKLNDSHSFFNVVNNIRNAIATAQQFLGNAKTALDNALSPGDWAMSLVNDVTQLVTFDTQIVAISKWRDVFNRIQRFEKLFDDDQSKASVELKRYWRATHVTAQVALAQEVIEQTRKEMATTQDVKTVSLTPLDLAVIRQRTRQVIQAAIRAERVVNDAASLTQVQIYKQVADQVHEQIQDLIETRPPITTAVVTMPCTMHWLAHYLYADMSRCGEISRLNPQLENPALIMPGMELVIYAQ